MKVLVINAGSSSLKYQLIDMTNEEMICKGLCDRIGINGSTLEHKLPDGRKFKREVPMKDHGEAFNYVKEALTEGEGKVINDISEVTAVGHRVVQGGDTYNQSTLVTDDVIRVVNELAKLAPLHNKANLQGITAAMAMFGENVPQVAVFDTSFHTTMPAKAYIYPIPYRYYEEHQIRRYGAHGTSHRFVTERCLDLLGKADAPEGTKIINCHLGNGSSLSAVKDGKCIDTSMGLTPLAGFMMGTRCGDLDPSIVTYIMELENLSSSEVNNILNKQSGLLGVSGVSSDDRDVSAAEEAGNERAALAHEILRYQITKTIGAYTAALNGIDAITFTAGLGENVPAHRQAICDALAYLGVKVDPEKNAAARGVETEISTPDSKVKVYVIPTNEELVIARDTKKIVEAMGK